MRIRKTEIDNSVEKLILTGMIVSSRFLREVEPIITPELFEIPYAKRVVQWCLNYFKNYQRAPKRHIEDLYNTEVRSGLDENQAELIGSFLHDISHEYQRAKKMNVAYLLDQAEKRFKIRKLSIVTEQAQTLLSRGKTAEAEHLLSTFESVQLKSGIGINPFTDTDASFNAFENDSDPLFLFPGRFGRMINRQLVRGGFIGLMAGEKKGKSFLLQEFGYQAHWYHNNVVFFGVGDMSQGQMLQRLHVRLCGRHYDPDSCGRILIPVIDCRRNQRDECRMNHRIGTCGIAEANEDEDSDMKSLFFKTTKKYHPCSHCLRRHPRKFLPSFWYKWREEVKPLTWREGLAAGKRLSKIVGRNKSFRLITYPTDTVNVDGLERDLDRLEKEEGLVADVVIVDYADILAPMDTKKDFRHQQNDTWKALRRLSLKRHALVISATQSDVGAYEQRSLRLKNFSEDKRKYAHVTSMLALNQTDLEKKLGVARMASLLARSTDFNVDDEVTLLQSLSIGRPILASY